MIQRMCVLIHILVIIFNLEITLNQDASPCVNAHNSKLFTLFHIHKVTGLSLLENIYKPADSNVHLSEQGTEN